MSTEDVTKDKLIAPLPPQLPLGVWSFGVLFLYFSGCCGLGVFKALSLFLSEGVTAAANVIEMTIGFVLFGKLSLGYFRGKLWAWWYTYANAAMMVAITPWILMGMLLRDAWRVNAMTLVVIGYLLIGYWTVRGLGQESVRKHFHVVDAGWVRSLIMIGLVGAMQMLFWYGPNWCVGKYLDAMTPQTVPTAHDVASAVHTFDQKLKLFVDSPHSAHGTVFSG